MPVNSSMNELTKIPGVGKSIASDLINIGIERIDDLKGKDPEKLYETSNQFAGCIQDRCLLYVFRCAVYFAETPKRDQDNEMLKWWNWKDDARRNDRNLK
jgi:Pathogenicity locus